ncbi:MAG: restriction endonuclease [Candidatus Margulisiibacteriota bacterium]|jgi:restriction system protein
MKKISYERIGLFCQAALRIILEQGGSCPVKKIHEEIEKKIEFNEYEKGLYEKSGYIRWQSILHFYSIDLVKAGWLRKHKGTWFITEEGKKALEMTPNQFIDVARKKYMEWAEARELIRQESNETDNENHSLATTYEQAQSTSREEIKEYIRNINPYDFQDLVAALFRGMGYYTPFVASKGPDGGIDIVAYKDPIGAQSPRIRIQVKHRMETKVGRPEVASLNGDLQKEGYIGVIVSTGGFSADALVEIRKANKHIEKINFDEFIDLWEEHYDKLSDEDKNLLPLRKVLFLAPEE